MQAIVLPLKNLDAATICETTSTLSVAAPEFMPVSTN